MEYGTGWYKIKVTGDNGKLRYAWVKANTISEKLAVPEIIVTPVDSNKGEGNNNWYLGPVKVVLTTDDENAKEIHYRVIENGITVKEDEIYKEEIEINLQGTTKIFAWLENEEGERGEESNKDIKIDSIAPTIIHKETSIKEKVGEWYKDDVLVEINGEDSGSGIDGYYYMVTGENTIWSDKKTFGENGDKIQVVREGITDISVKVVDRAGNEKEETITIKKDTEAPTFDSEIFVRNETINSFEISVLASDKASGNPANGGKVTYTCYIVGREEPVGENETGTFEVTGLDMGKTYSIKIIARDPAGNSNEKIGEGTTLSNRAPIFTIEPKEKSKTNLAITLTMKARDDDGDDLIYKVTYGKYDSNGNREEAIGTKETEEVAQGVAQDIEITGLSNYTNYWFEVEVTDGKSNDTSTLDIKTYCKGTSCSGYDEKSEKCTNCTNGKITTTCGTINYVYGDYHNDMNYLCQWCREKKASYRVSYTCSSCKNTYRYDICGQTGCVNVYGLKDPKQGSRIGRKCPNQTTKNCSKCSGSGNVTVKR